MFIELIDLLRCTRPHEDSWLVAAFHELRDRNVVEGLLSCPVCGARYPVREGIVWFDAEPEDAGDALPARPEEGMRVAAYLNLVEPGVVLLGGSWAAGASTVAELGSTVIAFNSPDAGSSARVSQVRCAKGLPFARECMDGIALDSSGSRIVDSAARSLKNGARMVAPVAAAVPAGVAEIARDAEWWVGAREGAEASAPVQIARR